MVRAIMERTSRAYGLDNQFLALPNYVQVGSPSGEGVALHVPRQPDAGGQHDVRVIAGGVQPARAPVRQK